LIHNWITPAFDVGILFWFDEVGFDTKYRGTSDAPLGFTLVIYGVYTSLNFAVPDWRGKNHGSNYIYYDDTKPYTDQNYEIINWSIGYCITVIPSVFYLPIGGGVKFIKEWRLQGYDWVPVSGADAWENTSIFEIGILFRPPMDIGPYLLGTYRYLGTKEHTFLISVGISSDFIFN